MSSLTMKIDFSLLLSFLICLSVRAGGEVRVRDFGGPNPGPFTVALSDVPQVTAGRGDGRFGFGPAIAMPRSAGTATVLGTDGVCDLGGECVPRLAPGADCSFDADCETGFCRNQRCCREDCGNGYCGNDLGVCFGLLRLGKVCEVDHECRSGICDRFEGVCCRSFCSDRQDCNSPWAPGQCVTHLSTCIADCDLNGVIAVHELVTAVSIALNRIPIAHCPEIDHDRDGRVRITDLILATQQAMTECRQR